MWGFTLVFIAIAATSIALIVRRGLQITALAHNGVVGRASILKKFYSGSGMGSSSEVLRYEFRTPNGRRYENKIHVSMEVYNTHNVGDPIDIVYLENQPEVNAAKYMVNLSREALNLPPL